MVGALDATTRSDAAKAIGEMASSQRTRTALPSEIEVYSVTYNCHNLGV